ncbi:MAG: acetyl-CoA hydrolase/transferase C-terminal domain-containing protein [Actinomycetota bacterium]
MSLRRDAHRDDPRAVLAHIPERANVVVPIANGEPVLLLDTIEAEAQHLTDVRIHQMHALRDRPYLHGESAGHLRHVAYFLSHLTRRSFAAGHCDHVPGNFSDVPELMAQAEPDLVVAASSMPDEHGYFSLGPCADYVASFIGKVPFFLEANPQMPRTLGRNQVHVTQIVGWIEADWPLVTIEPAPMTDLDRRIAGFIAERIPDRATIQAGIGAIPDATLEALRGHRDLGLHTELLSDGAVDLVHRGVLTGVHKRMNRNTLVCTFALGSRAVYDFVDENPAVEFWPVEYVNDPRRIGREPRFVSINATMEVDLLGQCASETLAGQLYSGSGGQADFARGAMFSEGGQGFIVLRSTTRDGSISRIRPQLSPGSIVTTNKNIVDKIVTEWGVAELRGRSVRERARSLISIAHPDHREELRSEADRLGFL